MDYEARVNVHRNICCKLLQGRYCRVNSQVVNATNKIDENNAEWSFAGKACKKKKDRTTESLKWQSHGVKIN